MSTARISSRRGGSPPGTPPTMPPWEQTPPGPCTPPGPSTPCGQTHACKHITLPQTSFAGGNYVTLSFCHMIFLHGVIYFNFGMGRAWVDFATDYNDKISFFVECTMLAKWQEWGQCVLKTWRGWSYHMDGSGTKPTYTGDRWLIISFKLTRLLISTNVVVKGANILK